MNKYHVTLTVLKSYIIPVEAGTRDEAEDAALQKYADSCIGIDQWEDLPSVYSVKTV